MRKERFLRKRHGLITAASDAEKFGVVVSTKPGQFRLDLALKLHYKLRNHRKESVIFIVDELDPMDFDYTDIDVIVSTACPGIALNDSIRYKKPIITPIELEIVIMERAWENYCPDMIDG
jgi:2-(3-amino-3-carboxypropyl)histidine synthase